MSLARAKPDEGRFGSRAVAAISACNFRLLGLSGHSVNRLCYACVERGLAAIALNVHLHDRGVVHRRSIAANVMALSEKTLPHSPHGWLAVSSRDRRS